MPPPPTPPTTTPDKPPHPVHHIYPIFVPADLSDNFIHAFSGATAGFVSGIATCPLDVIKTKLQAQGGWSRMGPGPGEVVYRGLFGTASTIWKDEGFRGMYRGLGPLILGYLPTWMVYFTVYEKAKKFLEPGESFFFIIFILRFFWFCVEGFWCVIFGEGGRGFFILVFLLSTSSALGLRFCTSSIEGLDLGGGAQLTYFIPQLP